jgi:hypothetical protein
MKTSTRTLHEVRISIAVITCMLAFTCSSHAATISLANFGGNGNGNPAAATTNRLAILAALSNSGNTINVPAGTYVVDNSTMVAIPNFTGTLVFDPNAVFVLTNSGGANGVPDRFGGFYFFGGTGATIQGMHIVWTVPPGTLRDNFVYAALKIAYTTNTTLTGTVIDGSRSAGIQFFACINPVVQNARVTGSLADGVDFFNVQNATANNIYTTNTGDDGLAFVSQGNSGAYDNYTGGTATNVVVLNSFARGITAVGARNISVSNFFVSNTTSSGILVDYEPTYNSPTQLPDSVSFSNGTIANAGQNGPAPPSIGTPNPMRGNRFGVEVDIEPATPTPHTARVNLSNIRIVGSYDRGVSAYMSSNLPNGSVTGSRIYSGSGQNGFVFRVPFATLSNLVADSNNYYGFYFTGIGTITAQSLYSSNNSLAVGSLNRALWVDAPSTSFTASNMYVIDTKSVATGYVVGEAGATGAMTGIQYYIPNGILSIYQWGGTGMSFTNPVINATIAMPVISGYNAFNPPASPTFLLK